MARGKRAKTGESARTKRKSESSALDDTAEIDARRKAGRGAGRGRRRDDDDVDENMHDEVSAHFFRQDKIALDRVSDGDDDSVEDDAVLRGIAGRGDGGMMGREGVMALPESDSSDGGGSSDDDDDDGDPQDDAASSSSSSDGEEAAPLIAQYISRGADHDDLSVDSEEEVDIARRLAALDRRDADRATDWGGDRRSYYDGDDGRKQKRRRRPDDEEDDPEAEEEEAARDVVRARMAEMDDADFFDGDGG
eukprot:CAMPEP_0194266972 /NCGR_PEP_ID=MMETSP0169-20130528/1681_1 /TAXON_ID=218684 /ORGANISM="Corethron pennatum, Strain L29A3" /LENGTH=249 /DNA_ID=CAMNT_0039007759 /DNA_START=41 /DNA_END=787 /DNA_ORIENTATION=-